MSFQLFGRDVWNIHRRVSCLLARMDAVAAFRVGANKVYGCKTTGRASHLMSHITKLRRGDVWYLAEGITERLSLASEIIAWKFRVAPK
jgi:hypothetical protein